MSTTLISKDVKNYFDFLFDKGFSIQSISENMGNWVATLESPQCLLRIINDHGEILLDAGPKSKGNTIPWFSLKAIVFQITEGQILLPDVQEKLPGMDQQYRSLAELLRKYWDQIMLLMGTDFADYEEKLVKAGKTVTRLYMQRYKASMSIKQSVEHEEPD